MSDDASDLRIATIAHQGRRYLVTCRIGFDGIEHVGRLWFCPEASADAGLPDRGAIPAKTREEVLALAQQLSEYDIGLRLSRALAEKRRFLEFRRTTDEILTKIRYL